MMPTKCDREEAVVYAGMVSGAGHVHLGGVLPEDPEASREAQTRSVLEQMAHSLAGCGMRMTDVVRTWFYLDNLLEWYDAFNEVRTAFFTEHGVFDGVVPASTGIGAPNPAGAALTAGLIAVRPRTTPITIEAVPSPLQCPALDYASSFSRAVEVAWPTHRTLYVSGTASIDPEGQTIFLDDPQRQIARTMEVVEAILTSRDMSWDDAVRGIAYYTDADAFEPMLQDYCSSRGIPEFPLDTWEADICRDDLLFEIEVDAVKPC